MALLSPEISWLGVWSECLPRLQVFIPVPFSVPPIQWVPHSWPQWKRWQTLNTDDRLVEARHVLHLWILFQLMPRKFQGICFSRVGFYVWSRRTDEIRRKKLYMYLKCVYVCQICFDDKRVIFIRKMFPISRNLYPFSRLLFKSYLFRNCCLLFSIMWKVFTKNAFIVL